MVVNKYSNLIGQSEVHHFTHTHTRDLKISKLIKNCLDALREYTYVYPIVITNFKGNTNNYYYSISESCKRI